MLCNVTQAGRAALVLVAVCFTTVAQTPKYDLNGIWLREDGQRTSVKQIGTTLIAVKLAGGYVPAGEVTWEGDYASNAFPGRIKAGDGKGRTWWVPVRISIQDRDTIRITGPGINRTYTREKTTSTGPGDFRLTIYRQYPGRRCTSGYLAINGKLIVYTLERPWNDNQQNISSIPAGTYPAVLRYDHPDEWRIELQDIEARNNVQIHIGNEPDESKGCILVGSSLTSDLCSIASGTSTPAYLALKRAFYGSDHPTATPEKRITVVVTDAYK